MAISDLTAALLSQYSYQPLGSELPNSLAQAGWSLNFGLSFWGQTNTGATDFNNQVVTMVNPTTQQIVITIKGTDSLPVLESDLTDSGALVYESLKLQVDQIMTSIAQDPAYAGYDISFDGHSTGGGAAQSFALLYSTSAYGQNSLPISPTALADILAQDGGVTADQAIADWRSAGNTDSEVNEVGDPATLKYQQVEGGTYLNTSTTTLSNPYVAGELFGAGLAALGPIGIAIGLPLLAASAYLNTGSELI